MKNWARAHSHCAHRANSHHSRLTFWIGAWAFAHIDTVISSGNLLRVPFVARLLLPHGHGEWISSPG